jgi:hypothetical protein
MQKPESDLRVKFGQFKGFVILLVLGIVAMSSGQGPNDDRAQLKKLNHQYEVAKKMLDQHPNIPSIRQRFVIAADRLATASMTSPSLDRKVKYRLALRLYRQVLKIEPKNHEAASNSALIESVYRSMGRPIPK